MSYDRADFKTLLADRAKRRQSDSIPAIRALQAAGVIAAKLTTGSDEWNRYLSYVQGRINQIRERKAIAQAQQNDPALWDAAELNKLKADILRADAMIEGLEWAMLIPKALVDGGAEATEYLNKLDKENADNSAAAQS